jgi:hypothetical protein
LPPRVIKALMGISRISAITFSGSLLPSAP